FLMPVAEWPAAPRVLPFCLARKGNCERARGLEQRRVQLQQAFRPLPPSISREAAWMEGPGLLRALACWSLAFASLPGAPECSSGFLAPCAVRAPSDSARSLPCRGLSVSPPPGLPENARERFVTELVLCAESRQLAAPNWRRETGANWWPFH